MPGIGNADSVALDHQTLRLVERRLIVGGIFADWLHRLDEQRARVPRISEQYSAVLDIGIEV